MITRTWRTTARTVGANLALGVAALATTGGVALHDLPPSDEAFSTGGLTLGTDYALVSARITANPAAGYVFAAPEIGIVAPTPVVTHPRRSVSNNPIPASIAGNAVLEEAAKYVGVPYVYGGTTPSGFDCTGFIAYVYGALGVSLPRDSSDYWNIGVAVSAEDARPGDLIVSNGHVGIYAGDGMQIDAPRPGKTIQFRAIWQKSYVYIRVS